MFNEIDYSNSDVKKDYDIVAPLISPGTAPLALDCSAAELPDKLDR
jgi:hypothetical protein